MMAVHEVLAAEDRASAMLDLWWWQLGRGLPVDPFGLARDLGITVRETHLPADVSGNIVIKGNATPVITLNKADSLNRRRFTCAHEIGHYERRTHNGGDQEFTDRRDTLAGMGVDPGEILANQFASALLMPDAHVRRLFHEGRRSEDLARVFGTSPQAMELRLKNLRLVS